jgi:SAM-dependent methyltransferase
MASHPEPDQATKSYLALRASLPGLAQSADAFQSSIISRRIIMRDTTTKVREHYNAEDLRSRIKSALATIPAEDQTLRVDQLAPLDQFHTRGILATAELAAAAGLEPSTRVLDLGCGVGGPARYLAATFDCRVTDVDLSPGFIDAANYLTAPCGLSDRATFRLAMLCICLSKTAHSMPHSCSTWQ